VSGNPIHKLLDDLSVPWRLPPALAERYGIREHPAYQWDVIAIETSPPIVRGLMWPLDCKPVRNSRRRCRRVTASSANAAPAEQSELEFVREPMAAFALLFGTIGRSADGTMLVFWHRQLYLVPIADVIGFRARSILGRHLTGWRRPLAPS